GDLVFQQRGEVEIRAGEMILGVGFIEIVRVGVDDAAREHVDAENRILPAQLRGVERPRVVAPAEMSDQPLIAVNELLSPDFQRKRKLLVIADEDKRLMNIDARIAIGEALAGGG